MDSFDREHLRDIAALERRVWRIYATASREAARIAASSGTRLKPGEEFDFDRLPATRRRMRELMRWLRDSIHTAVVDGVRTAYELSRRKGDAQLREALGDMAAGMTEEAFRRYFSPSPSAADAFVASRSWASPLRLLSS